MEADILKKTPLPSADQPELITIHALLYSIYAERKAVLAERLRWRERLSSTAAWDNLAELKERLLLLRNRSRELCARKRALEAEQSSLMKLK